MASIWERFLVSHKKKCGFELEMLSGWRSRTQFKNCLYFRYCRINFKFLNLKCALFVTLTC